MMHSTFRCLLNVHGVNGERCVVDKVMSFNNHRSNGLAGGCGVDRERKVDIQVGHWRLGSSTS